MENDNDDHIDILANCVLSLLADGLRLKGFEVTHEFSQGGGVVGGVVGNSNNALDAIKENRLFKIAVCQNDVWKLNTIPGPPEIEVIDEDHDGVYREQADKVTLDKILTAISEFSEKYPNPRD